MFKHYLPNIIIFSVAFAAAVPVLYYIRRRNPDPRFRPNLGEMTLMTVLALFVCGGLAVGLGGLFRAENDGSSLNKKPDEGSGWSSAGGSGPEERRKSKDSEKDSRDGEAPKRRLFDRN